MTQRTRYFLIASALVLSVGLGTGLVAYYNGSLPLGLGRSADAELAYVPADSAAVGYADVRAIMDSEFRQKLRQMLPTGEEKDKLQAEIGLDIERDIDTVVASFMGDASPSKGAAVVVRGRFNDAQIETMATQHGAVAEEYHGKRILMLKGDAPEAPVEGTHAEVHATGGLAFLEPGVLVLGEAGAIKRAIDAGASGENITKNDDLMKLIGDVRGGNNAWIVGRFDAMASAAPLPAQVKDQIPAIEYFAVSAHVNGGITGTIRADTRDDKAAEQLRDVVRGALAAGRLMAGQNSQADAVLNSLQIIGTGKTVGMTFTVPTQVLDVLNGVAAMKNLGTGEVRK